MMLTSLCLSLLISSVVAFPSPAPHDISRQRVPLAPLYTHEAEYLDSSLNNSYIIILKDGIQPSVVDNHFNFLRAAHEEDPLLADGPVGIDHVYDFLFNGYSGRFADSVVQRIREMPEVAYVEENSVIYTLDTQHFGPWGLARVSHRERLGFGTLSLYEHDSTGGEGVDVYIIDTGINIDHVEFEGRASWGITIPRDAPDEDERGHGTHCAGTVGSRKYGVAKAANLIAVKVFDTGRATTCNVVAGINWAAKQAAAKLAAAKAEYAATGKTKHKGSVANMSFADKSPGLVAALNDAVVKAIKSGMHVAVAAGNDNMDACSVSPAAVEQAITVGASTLGDERALFSNHGKCVDVFAPGLNVLSTWVGSDTAVRTLSGTSMATPHVAGLLAYLLSIYPSKTFDPHVSASVSPVVQSVPQRVFETMVSFARTVVPTWVSSILLPPALETFAPIPFPTLTPDQLKRAVLALSTPDILTGLLPDTPNLLIFNNATTL